MQSSDEIKDWFEYDRVVKSVPIPHRRLASMQDIYGEADKPNIKNLENILKNEGRLEKEVISKILNQTKQLLRKEPNMVVRSAPINICGDIHGQFYDLLKLFEVGGDPSKTNYLFLGDYVDRGYFSTECVLLLYSLKINYPGSVTLLRGNHECKHLTNHFTFKKECLQKYDEDVYVAFLDTFNHLPLSAYVNKQFLCVHGGLSPEIQYLKDYLKIDRFSEPPSQGPFCDTLWADPSPTYGRDHNKETFSNNSVRGCSFTFGYEACCKFLDNNGLLSVVRAHEAQDTGYRMYSKNPRTGFPSLITVFSAPNYLDVYNNGAAILIYENNVLNIKQFNHSPHPFWLPNFMNVFTWSVPFVCEKVMEILGSLLEISIDDVDESEFFAHGVTRKDIVKNKIRAVSKMSRVFGVLRQQQESVIKLKGLAPNGSLPVGFLAGGSEAIDQAIQKINDGQAPTDVFSQARQLDLINERMPPPSGDL